jgi:hypothetical protein
MNGHPNFAPPLRFVDNIDMGGGLQHPLIAGALVLCALGFAVWMTLVLRSSVRVSRKALMLVAILALATVAGPVAERMTEAAISWMEELRSPNAEFGFIGQAPLGFVPLVTVALTSVGQAVRALWRRATALHTR